jgi:spore photoproduct lyase
MIGMKLFQPKRVFIEEDALQYPLGAAILAKMNAANIPVKMIGSRSHNRVTGIPGNNPRQSYHEAKETLVVGVKRDLRLNTCKPSADFEFAIGTGCPGGCQYCYLQTYLGKKPYIRVYVNLDEILAVIRAISEKNCPKITTFEAASTSDPLAVEHITGSLTKTIKFFAGLNSATMRVVTKFAAVEPLLTINHQNRTRFRFSLNTGEIIRKFEPNTATLEERLTAANKIRQAKYPLGFIIAPLFIYPGYEAGYTELFQRLRTSFDTIPEDLTFELITHRFTKRAKNIILERFPETQLDLNEMTRHRKYGKYGLVKYIYPEPDYSRLKEQILANIAQFFPKARVEYFT